MKPVERVATPKMTMTMAPTTRPRSATEAGKERMPRETVSAMRTVAWVSKMD